MTGTLRLIHLRADVARTLTIRLTPALAEWVAAELVERAREARAAEEGQG